MAAKMGHRGKLKAFIDYTGKMYQSKTIRKGKNNQLMINCICICNYQGNIICSVPKGKGNRGIVLLNRKAREMIKLKHRNKGM